MRESRQYKAGTFFVCALVFCVVFLSMFLPMWVLIFD
jgi:hypothetical protein